MIRIHLYAAWALVAVSLLGSASLARAVSLTDSYTDGGNWNTVYAQGFSPALAPNPDYGFSFNENISLERFQFFKSGTPDAIGTAGNPANVQLVILNNIFGDITNLSTSSPLVVGLSSNSIGSTAALATGAPITFQFNALQLRYGNSYAAVVVSNNGGLLTPVRMSALTANYAESSPGLRRLPSDYELWIGKPVSIRS